MCEATAILYKECSPIYNLQAIVRSVDFHATEKDIRVCETGTIKCITQQLLQARKRGRLSVSTPGSVVKASGENAEDVSFSDVPFAKGGKLKFQLFERDSKDL